MASLRIFGRHQALCGDLRNSVERVLSRKRFYDCVFHRVVLRKPFLLEWSTFQSDFQGSRFSRFPPTNLFGTKASLNQNLTTPVSKVVPPIEKGKLTSGSKKKSRSAKKSKTVKKDKNQKDKESSKSSEKVTGKTSEIKQHAADTGPRNENKDSSSKTTKNSKKQKNKKSSKIREKVTAKTPKNNPQTVNSVANRSKKNSSSKPAITPVRETSATNNLTERSVADTNITINTKEDHLHHVREINYLHETLPLTTPASAEDHPMDYIPEALYLDDEVSLHGREEMTNEIEEPSSSNLADATKKLEADPHLVEPRAGIHEEDFDALDDLESISDVPFEDSVHIPKKFREGTVGGRLFEEQTLAEIDGYLYLGKPNDAEKLFKRYLRMGKTFEVHTFNKLLHGWAFQGNLMSIKLLFNLLKKEGLEPDIGTYAALLHGYGKFDNVEGIQNIIKEMEDKKFDVKHIFHQCSLSEPQARGVLKALQLVKPHYTPVVPESLNQARYPSLVKSWYSDRNNLEAELKSDPGNLENKLDESKLKEFFEEQISREVSGLTPILSVENERDASGENEKSKAVFLACRSKWRKALILSIEKEMLEIKNSKGKSVYPRFAPFIQAFEPDELADITLDTIVFYVKGRIEGVPLYGVSGALGSVLNTKYIVKHRMQSGMLDKMKDVYHDYFSYLMDENVTASKMAREFWNELDCTRPFSASLQQEVPNWPWATKLVFGCFLVDLFLKSAQLDVNVFNNKTEEKMLPAFYHTYEFKVDKKLGVLKPHPIVCRLFKGYLAKQGEIFMETTSVPMLVPPRPWRATKDGAYLILPVELVRSAYDEDGRYDKLLEEKTDKEDLVAIFDSLNFLGSCAWRTNKRILDIAIRMFNSGGNEDLAIPGPVVQPETDIKLPKGKIDPEERKKQIHERRISKKLAREQYSLRMSCLYKLSVANHFRDHVFWLPINLDFRGRVYPIPPHCSHVGDDLSRGMLQFAKGVPLGEKGLDRLKIHLVTLHGAQKKASLDERLQYANNLMEDVLDSANNPLTGRGWWMTSDDPWQTLATCMEIADALRSPDPTQFISHQPVHQDGSCNGLQHYAALGQDSYGAKQVNLMPADRPQDVYEEVAKLVEAARLRDASTGQEIAKELEGKVTRRVVKQTVMTIVYGVTFVGGRLQIERQLKDLEMDDKLVFKASTYLVAKVFDSIGEMFTAARAIQNWFASSATQIALSGHYVDWYTPLGLYVSQPYSKNPPRKVVRTKLQWMLIKSKGLPHIPPDSRKQRGAFPPNFVHSLDSTHMMLTALYCQRSGATFSSVHDSFWTHAANVGVMNRICREQFVKLHSQPILEELQKHFEKNYANLKLIRPLKSKGSGEERTHASFQGRPKPGDFDLKDVLNSTYFFC
ncbi:DNA-directed RNA polymerase, mitochondrial-like [Montipora capricornis]|uniref:DNA-directed RNA polymerase, mitochondrial-like n=1 Tax=Montipora capricornis TaxID=246305 RepID=UPI0035F16DCD